MMSIQIISNGSQHMACSQYGPNWAGPDGDRLTVLIALLKELPAQSVNLNSFDEHLEYPPSVNVQAIIEASTPWVVDENATNYLHTDKEAYCVAISQSTDVPNWPDFETKEYDKTMQDDLNVQWNIEVEGVSQGAYVSQAQHTISVPSRLGLKAQIDGQRLIWPPRQLNAIGQRIDSEGKQLSETATILTWTRLSAAGAPSEFSNRAPILDGVATVLVEFDEGPKGVFMLADDESGKPEIDERVHFVLRRLYGQDGMMHYGLKAMLSES